MSLKPLSISLLSVEGVAIAEFSGTCFEGLESHEQLFEPVERHAERNGWRLAVGLSGVTFLNSRGISAVLSLRSACERHGGCFVIYELFEAAEHALVTLKLMPILKIATSREGAVRLCLEHRPGKPPPAAKSAGPPGAGLARPPRLAVMISGAGRTFVNLADRIAAGSLDATIPLVVASRECPGAAAARERGIAVRVMPGRVPRARLEAALDEFDIDFVVLAGYLHYVEIPPAYAGRVVNIHPALLPAHGGKGMHGLHVHRSVLKAGDRESGCTVHLVDDEYDHGPILLQARCPVIPGDTPEALASRVFALELETYPRALNLLFDRAAARPWTKRRS